METEELRHHFVMVRRSIPRVPRPDGTPLPTSRLDAEQRGMNVKYWKPFVWTNANGSIVDFDYENSVE